MTITDLTVAAAVTGVNTSLAPGAPSGVQEGDLVVILAATAQSPSYGLVDVPAGWTALSESDNVRLLGKFWETGDSMPTVTFTNLGATSDVYARAFKARGVGKDVLTEVAAEILGGSAQNINYPALDVPGDDHLVVLAAWKGDDASAYSTPATMTAQGMTSVTAGGDMSVALYTRIETDEVDFPASSITVTGGASAATNAIMCALKPAPSVTADEQDAFPPRVLVTVAGLTPGDSVVVYRNLSGDWTPVRAGSSDSVIFPGFLVLDAELPFGVPISYVAVVNGSAEYETSPVTYVLPGGLAVLSDAISGLSSTFQILAWPEKRWDPRTSRFQVGGRNVIVSGDLGQFTGEIEIFFEAYSSSAQLEALVRSATEGVLQLRRPTDVYEGVDCYLSVLGLRQQRYSQDGSDPRRSWVLEVAETDAWSSGLEAVGTTLGDLADAYFGQTLGDLSDDFATLLELAQAEF